MSRVFKGSNRDVQPLLAHGQKKGRTASSPSEILERAREEARETIRLSREEASGIVEDARCMAATLAEDAVSEGIEKGRKDGYEWALGRCESMLREAEELRCRVEGMLEDLIEQGEPVILALAMDTAKRLVGETLVATPEAVLNMVREAMAVLKDETEFTIRVKPLLVPLIEGSRDKLKADSGARAVEVVADEWVGDGCVVKSPHGFVDARVEEQIRNLANAVGEARRNLGEESPR